jgi:hypothetical protein
MLSDSQYGQPVFLSDLQAPSSVERLTRIQFGKGDESTTYDEAWLQNLIMSRPGLLPSLRHP